MKKYRMYVSYFVDVEAENDFDAVNAALGTIYYTSRAQIDKLHVENFRSEPIPQPKTEDVPEEGSREHLESHVAAVTAAADDLPLSNALGLLHSR